MDSNNIIFLGFADNKIPEFKEVKSKDWIMYGEKNDFPEHLLYLYNKSSNHNAIINGKSTYIFGKGFPNGNFPVNPAGETFNKVVKKFITDIELFGGGRIEVIWKVGGGAELRHIPFQRLRRAKEDNGFWYCKDWTKRGWSKENEPVFIPDYDPENKGGVQVFAYNEYRPGADVYPLPGYFGALNDIETDVEISKYNLSVIKNGMFSSKMIVFNDGVPTDEIKGKIEKDFKRKFAGSENSGNFMLVFNNDPAKAPQVQDLSTTDLDKLFDQLNKTTQGEIFSGHGVTSPMLFGIRTEGQLGGRSEIVEAYEIFKNTYVNEKQQAIEDVAAVLLPIIGQTASKIEPVEPITDRLNPVDFKDMLPQEWVFEKLGIDTDKYQPADSVPTVSNMPVNENLKNLSGRQMQQLQRVLSKYKNGKLTRPEATLLLRNSYGIADQDIEMLLGSQNFEKVKFSINIPEGELIKLLSDFYGSEWDSYPQYKKNRIILSYRKAEKQTNDLIKKYGSAEAWYLSGEGRNVIMSESITEEQVAMMFEEIGETKSNFHVVKSMKFDDVDMSFADLSQVDANIVDQLKKDKRATPATIAAAIKSTPGYVGKRIEDLKKSGVLTQTSKVLGVDTIIETAINPEVIDYKPKAETLDVYVKYSYEVKPGAGPELIPTSRPFCKKLIELDRLYTRAEIEMISGRLGYSVFDRGGGFWGDRPSCRHEWRRNLVIKKRVA